MRLRATAYRSVREREGVSVRWGERVHGLQTLDQTLTWSLTPNRFHREQNLSNGRHRFRAKTNRTSRWTQIPKRTESSLNKVLWYDCLSNPNSESVLYQTRVKV